MNVYLQALAYTTIAHIIIALVIIGFILWPPVMAGVIFFAISYLIVLLCLESW